MSDTPFVHLHCHTDYSLLDGACEIGRMMDVVAQMKMPAIGMTDHGNLFGAVEFYNQAKSRGIHPVLGCEMYVTQNHKVKSGSEATEYNHFLLLAENQDGYRNLVDLVSTGHLDGFYYKPRIDKDLLAAHAKGLIATSACLAGDINEALVQDKYADAKRLAGEYQEMFGRGNFFLEIQDHGLDEDKKLLPYVFQLSRDLDIPLIASNDAHYLTKADSRAHDIMLCIQTGKTVADPNRMRFTTEEFYLKSREEMLRLFPEHEAALDITWEIAQRCQVKIEKVKNPFPKFDVPDEHDIDSYFAFVARAGLDKRRPYLERQMAAGLNPHSWQEYIERLEREIRIIQEMKFPGYFLIVWDFIRHARQTGVPVGPGRGSAAGSLVSYAMEITDIDPLQYGLLFERFLNPERISMPDIDIDFHTKGRESVIRYVTEKYGREQVAQIITFGTLGAKAAIKDVGRALGLSFKDSDTLTKLVPPVLDIKLKTAFEMEPQFGELRKKDPVIDELLDVAQRLEGMARNSSIHAAGVVISPQPLKELVPLYRTKDSEIVTQYDMVMLEKIGLLKMDFLGLATLDIIDDALKLIERRRGLQLHINDLPLDDKATYDLFGEGATNGVFQFESKGMKDVLRRYKPTRLEDLCALNALYRPGPIKGGMIDDFIDRKHGRKKVEYELPQLEPILKETLGVIVYQEQVMQIASAVSGYSLGEADLLRRAMGKKKKEEMDQQRARFLSGALERNVPEKKATKIFDLMEQFAGYGFNKSHSAAYAFLAYVTGYLKANYPQEFMSALLTSETGTPDKVTKAINEARERGLQVLPPDVNYSGKNFEPDGEAIRFGLSAIKNVGEAAVEKILAAREEAGKFRSLHHFAETVESGAINRRMIESLIKAGAMDSFGAKRSQLNAVIDAAMEAGARAQRDADSGQTGLFGEMLASEEHADPPLPNLPEISEKDRLAGEKEMIGFYVTGHPLDAYAEKIAECATHDSSMFEDLTKGTEMVLCGVINSIQRRKNKDNDNWAILMVEDRLGTFEALVFAKQYGGIQQFLVEDTAVKISGTAMPDEGAPKRINVKDVVPLDKVAVHYPSLMGLRVPVGRNGSDEEKLRSLSELFRKKPGSTSVRLKLERRGDFVADLDVPLRVRPDREFKAEIEKLLGPDAFITL